METILGRSQLFIILCTIPVFAAFLATTQQLVGGYLLAPAVVLLLLSDLIPFFVDRELLLSPEAKTETLLKSATKQQWIGRVMLTLACICTIMYIQSTTLIVEHIKLPTFLPPLTIAILICDSFARGTLTRVVSVDLILDALCKQKSEKEKVGEEGVRNHEERLKALTVCFEDDGGSGSGSGAKVMDCAE